jgi:hypothetical protein
LWVAEPAWASSADGEIGTLGVIQPECLSQSSERFGVWKAPRTSLQVRDAAHAEARTLGELLLRQTGRMTELPQDRAETAALGSG